MGLLKLQASRAKDKTIKNEILAAKNRIQMNLVLYDRLYRSENFSVLSAKDYIHSLANEIMKSYDFDTEIVVELNIEDYMLEYKILFPLGIILNEILTNAIKYAFTGIDAKKITIQLKVFNDYIILIIKDNGVGMPETIHPQVSTGFGLQLVNMMIQQINGSMKIIREKGTEYHFQFNIDS